MTAVLLSTVCLLSGCGKSAIQKATDNAITSAQELTLADDQVAIANDAAGPRGLADTKKLIYDMQQFKTSDSEQTKQIKMALLAVVGVCPACAQLLQDESP